MFENWFFDYLMGYLSLFFYNRFFEGLKLNEIFLNLYNGFEYLIFHFGNPGQKLLDDLLHERPHIGTQIDPDPDVEPYSMKGFVRSYAQVRDIDFGDKLMVMGYYIVEDVPTTHFF